MVSMKLSTSWKAILMLVSGIFAFFIYLYLFNVDIPKIIAIVRTIDLNLYLLALVFVILDTFFFAWSWHALINFLSVKLSVVKAFLYVWYGLFIDIVIPAESVSAEISKIYLVAREHTGSTGKVVASLVLQRLMGMGLNIVGLLVGTSVLLTQMQVGGLILNLTLFLAIASIISLILLSLFLSKRTWTMKAIDVALRFVEYVSRRRWKLDKIRADVIKAANIFHDSLKQFKHAPKALFTSLFLNVIAWLLSISVAYIVFLSMRFEVNWGVIITTYSIISAIQGIPIGVPFEAGLPEITMTALYGPGGFGIPFDISATATILTRILTVWLRFFIGFVVQQGLEIRAMSTTRAISQAGKT